MKLEGKIAIVTGGASGIGRAIAHTFAKEGAIVVIADIDLPSSEKVVDEIKSLRGKAQAIKTDVTKSAEVNQLVGKTLDTFKKIDILVNNAGITLLALPEKESEAQWDSQIATNLKGPFLCSQAVGRQMIKQKRGKIVNIASTSAHRGTSKAAAYSASKGGVVSLSQVLAVDWAKYNINVNVVSPGTTLTPIIEKLGAEVKDTQEFMRKRAEAIPLQRMNRPEEIASVVLFLVSAESDAMTGQVVIMDGGACALHPSAVSTLRE